MHLRQLNEKVHNKRLVYRLIETGIDGYWVNEYLTFSSFQFPSYQSFSLSKKKKIVFLFHKLVDQTLSGLVLSVCVSMLQVELLLQKIRKFRGSEIAWDHFWANTMVLGGQTTEFLISTLSAHCIVQHWFWLSDGSPLMQATSRMRLARL